MYSLREIMTVRVRRGAISQYVKGILSEKVIFAQGPDGNEEHFIRISSGRRSSQSEQQVQRP